MRYIRSIVRFILFVLLTFGLYFAWLAGSFIVPNKQYWRQLGFSAWARGFARIAGMRIEVIGQPPKPPFFLVSNHLGWVDIPALRAVVDGVFVAKVEIQKWFVAGKMASDMGQVFVNRQSRRDIPRAGSSIIAKLNEGEGVIVFPEGTSTRGDDVLPFNSSFLQFAAETDLPVSYASITYRTAEGEQPASETICWWDNTSLLRHILLVFSVREFTAIINFGDEPIVSTDRKKLAADLRNKVKQQFIPVI